MLKALSSQLSVEKTLTLTLTLTLTFFNVHPESVPPIPQIVLTPYKVNMQTSLRYGCIV